MKKQIIEFVHNNTEVTIFTSKAALVGHVVSADMSPDHTHLNSITINDGNGDTIIPIMAIISIVPDAK